MTETPVADEIGQDTAANSRSSYLPVPPKDWQYAVELHGPNGERISVADSTGPERRAAGIVVVTVRAQDTMKEFDAPSLREGAKAAVNAAKALAQIAEHEKSAAEAKQKLLDTIGVEVAEEPKAAKYGKPGPVGDLPDATTSAER